MEKVLITGATGLIGTHLTPLLQERGYEVVHLGRKPSTRAGVRTYKWDPLENEIDEEVLAENVDHVIHLAGASIAGGRWTPEYKQVLEESRIQGAALLYSAFARHTYFPGTFITASGINYYGTDTTDTIHTEDEPPAQDFLGRLCRRWEHAADRFSEHARVVKLRTGVVLDRNEGALAKMAAPVQFFVGAPLGSGHQYVPWIHIDDICRLYVKALEDERMHGAYNAVAPEHVTNRDLTRAIGRALTRPVFLPPVPAFLLTLALGEKAGVVLEGSRASCEKIKEAGFEFRYEQLDAALQKCVRG